MPHLTLGASQLQFVILPFGLGGHEGTDDMLPSLNFYDQPASELIGIKKNVFEQGFYSSIHKFIELKEFDNKKYLQVNPLKIINAP